MDVFDKDSRHPKYQRAIPHANGSGLVDVEIYFRNGEASNIYPIEYHWSAVPDGVEVNVKKPDITGADDLKQDIELAIADDLRRHIVELNWY